MFRKIIKKLNNFQFTAKIGFVVSVLGALYGIAGLLFYHFAGEWDGFVRHVGFSSVENGPYYGLITFFASIITVFASCYIAYSFVKFIINKEKMLPRKGLLLGGFISGIFEALLIGMLIFLLVIDNPNTAPWIYVTLNFGILSALAQILLIVPFCACNFYMPEVKKD